MVSNSCIRLIQNHKSFNQMIRVVSRYSTLLENPRLSIRHFSRLKISLMRFSDQFLWEKIECHPCKSICRTTYSSTIKSSTLVGSLRGWKMSRLGKSKSTARLILILWFARKRQCPSKGKWRRYDIGFHQVIKFSSAGTPQPKDSIQISVKSITKQSMNFVTR